MPLEEEENVQRSTPNIQRSMAEEENVQRSTPNVQRSMAEEENVQRSTSNAQRPKRRKQWQLERVFGDVEDNSARCPTGERRQSKSASEFAFSSIGRWTLEIER
jgi:hypothetical protein